MPVAVRLPRSVAARRTLLTAFFLGSFLGLALLFGGSAHAASVSKAAGSSKASAAHEARLSAQDVRAAAGRTHNSGPHAAGSHRPQANGPGADKPAPHKSRTHKSRTHKSPAHKSRTHTAGSQRAAGTGGGRAAASGHGFGGSGGDRVVGPVARGVERTHDEAPVGRAVEGAADRTGSTAGRAADRAGLDDGRGDLSLPLPQLPGLGHAGSGGHTTEPPGGGDPGGTHGPAAGSGGKGAYGPNSPGTQHGSPAVDGGWPPAGTLGQDAAVHDGRQGDGGAGPERPLHGTPAVPAGGSAQSAAHGGGGQGGGPDQLAGYISDSERFGPLRPGAVAAVCSAPTRERAGDILEFPG